MKKIIAILVSMVLVMGLSGCIKFNNGGEVGGENGGEINLSNGELETIAKCLTEKNTTMYGAVWCGHCANQKKSFGDAFKYINYVECDPNTDVEGAKKCLEEEIPGYPAWKFSDGSIRTGFIPPAELAELVGC